MACTIWNLYCVEQIWTHWYPYILGQTQRQLRIIRTNTSDKYIYFIFRMGELEIKKNIYFILDDKNSCISCKIELKSFFSVLRQWQTLSNTRLPTYNLCPKHYRVSIALSSVYVIFLQLQPSTIYFKIICVSSLLLRSVTIFFHDTRDLAISMWFLERMLLNFICV